MAGMGALVVHNLGTWVVVVQKNVPTWGGGGRNGAWKLNGKCTSGWGKAWCGKGENPIACKNG